MKPSRPLLIYDGECRFCCRWIERWRAITKEKVNYETSQTAAVRFPEILPESFAASVQWIGDDGLRCAGAEAVLRALATGSWLGRMLLAMFLQVPLFAQAADGVYGIVARNREKFSFLTRLLWGADVRPPTYATANGIFLRLLGVIYLIAFASFAIQAEGLIGDRGILPAGEFFAMAKNALGAEAFWQLPSFCWWAHDSAALQTLSYAGIVAAFALIVGVAPAPCLIFLWIAYLSLTIAGQDFYQFQWDFLLLETGFLAIFAAPWNLFAKRSANPPGFAHFLLIWLLFRVMFASGVVKLSSGDANWREGLAMNFHYFTQPLPTPLAWFAHQMPEGLQKMSVCGMFGIELLFPFLLFFPRRLRLLGAGGLAALQVVIALTGNYGFFNFLTLALCVLAVDDVVFQKIRWKSALPPKPLRFLPKAVGVILAVVIFVLSLVPLLSSFRKPMPLLAPLIEVYEIVAPFRTINGYGLFAVMTTERREILIQGSRDGKEWKTYTFRYKPGDPRRAPPWVAPYMPRLDWQMWFAALGTAQDNPWFFRFMERLLQGSPAVLELLESDPFAGEPPKMVRAQSGDYSFTTAEERRAEGNWWKVRPDGPYFPEATLRR